MILLRFTRIPGVAALVGSRELDEGPWRAVAASGDADLRARKIELGLIFRHGHVETDVLDAEEVVP